MMLNKERVGRVYEYGSQEFRDLIPEEEELPGARAVIVMDIEKVGTVRQPRNGIFHIRCSSLISH